MATARIICNSCGHPEEKHTEPFGCSDWGGADICGCKVVPKDDPDELICVACDHPESAHMKGSYGAVTGCNGRAGKHHSTCSCNGFVRPSPRQQESTRYRRPRFSQTSGRNEIGTGSTRTVNLQGRGLAKLPGQRDEDIEAIPEWVMFGIKQPDGSVLIYASTKLSYLTMRQEAPGEFEKIHRELINEGVISDKPWQVSGRMVGYIVESASNYVDALRNLITRGWQSGGEEPTTEDLQRRAALEDAAAHERRESEQAKEPEPEPHYAARPDDEIFDAEIVEDEDDERS